MTEPLFELPPVEPSTTGVTGVGKPRLLKANRQQVEMRLAALDDLLAPDHLARVIWALVEQMELSPFYAPIQAVEGQAGHPAIDPAILVGLWLYATADGVGSARELDRLCTEHLAYQWLCGGVSVNYHTLADFRVTHERELDGLLTRQVAALTPHLRWVQVWRPGWSAWSARPRTGSASAPVLGGIRSGAASGWRRLKRRPGHG